MADPTYVTSYAGKKPAKAKSKPKPKKKGKC